MTAMILEYEIDSMSNRQKPFDVGNLVGSGPWGIWKSVLGSSYLGKELVKLTGLSLTRMFWDHTWSPKPPSS